MWQEKDNLLVRQFTFQNFKEAFAFMTEVAAIAEELDHHPWWSNVYQKVEIRLTTYDAGRTVTQKDHDLAQRIDEVAGKFSV
ncbi:4a-hydroxytetrahydrobiopterin dehydratase [Rufibacter sp. LB8]|uniref:4a-hydroxytetrahydrobiopterin dehydratase n=1 Tax=Rufibacter sp. LB8 TaxID=2777781 RepID=UPI00178C26F9|nr:4a-hydroxytetrahydrobiopterin dehydratase [Rufibacter sp. LB8]